MQDTGALLKRIKHNLLFFTLSKGVAFLAPIFFLKFVSLEEYGVVEFSYAFGSVAAVIASLGLAGAYPYFILKREEREKQQTFLFYGIPVLGLSVIACLLRWTGLINTQISLIILFTLIFALQRIYSSILKSEGKGHLGVLIDGGYYFILTVVILIVWPLHLMQVVRLLEGMMQAYLLVLSGFFLWRFLCMRTKTISAIIREDCREILHFSSQMIISGIVIYWLTSCARIYIKYFLGYEQVGIYSLYYRFAGIAIVIHQFMYIAFFKQLYMANPRKMDNYYLTVMGLVFGGSLCCFFFAPLLSHFFFDGTNMGNSRLFLLLIFQMPIWVGISLCEGVVSRENMVRQMNFRIGALVLLFPLVLLLIRNHLSLELFALINGVFFVMAFGLQLWLLRRKGILLYKCIWLTLGLLIGSIIIYFIY